MPVPRINVLVLAAALALACTSDSRRLDSETGLGSYEEVVLAESGTSFVGEGPGEWSMGPTVVTLHSDSIAIVGDGMFWRAVDIPRAELLWSRQRPSAMSGALTSANGVIYADRYDRANRSTLFAFRSSADSAVPGGPFPELMAANRHIGQLLYRRH